MEGKARVLIIGATGRVGSQIVKELDQNNSGLIVRFSSTNQDNVNKWEQEGREASVLDLDKPETFGAALKGVDRVFLLTGYTSDMLRQSKMLVDAAVDAGVSHMVHLGVFTSRRDLIPHFNWHDLIETYIEASGIAWTHLHPNVISDSILITDPPMTETGFFSVSFGNMPQGWVFASDIAAVAGAVLREGPEKHASVNYWLSTEVLTGPEIAKILSEASGREIICKSYEPESMLGFIEQITSIPVRAYMESALITMQLAAAGKMQAQLVVKDDVQTVLGRPGKTMAEWGREYFNSVQ